MQTTDTLYLNPLNSLAQPFNRGMMFRQSIQTHVSMKELKHVYMHTVKAVSNELEVAQPQLKSSPRNGKHANNKGVDSAGFGVSDQETNLVRIMKFRRPNRFTVLYKITS